MASRQIKLKTYSRTSKFGIQPLNYPNFYDSSSSPEEKSKKSKDYVISSPEIDEEYEKLEIQPFGEGQQEQGENQQEEKKLSEMNLNDQIIENVNEIEVSNQISEDYSPGIKLKYNKGNMTVVENVKKESDDISKDDEIDEIMNKHRHTFSKRMLDSNKSKSPEETEQKYMSALGKSIVAFHYKSKVSKNPGMKRFKTIYPEISTEESKENGDNQYSPTNKIMLIPIRKFFRLGSMQEINFQKPDTSEECLKDNEKQEIISKLNIESITDAKSSVVIDKNSGSPSNNNKTITACPSGSKLFEDFLVIGVDKSDLNAINPADYPKASCLKLMPKILYSFRNEAESCDLEYLNT